MFKGGAGMKFFVVYENVNCLGFRGAEFLLPEDEVILFYSKTCQTLEQAVVRKIYDSGCSFSVCKLERTGNNALDFYITSHIGEVLGRGYNGAIAIVSHDKGFRAIYDYWKARNPEMKIVCKPEIASCIISSNENSFRQRQLCIEKKTIEIEKAFLRFERRDQIRKELSRTLDNENRNWDFSKLSEELMQKQAGRETYLDLMHTYGIIDGQAIYRVLKKVG